MEIKNHTLYDKALLIKYNDFYLKDFVVKNFSIMGVVAIGVGVYLAINGDWSTAGILVAFVFAYLIMTVVIQKITANRSLKKSPLVSNPLTQNYTFTDEGVTVEGVKTRELKYEEIIKFSFSKLFLMFYDSNRRAFVVDLSKFENIGDEQALKIFLGNRLGKKFK
jgi:hypothetical protein